MKKGLLTYSFILLSVLAMAQQTPAFRQFYFNSYLFNPGFAGISGYTEVSVFYRQQWLGFNNAPVATGFSLQHVSRNRASFGMNFLSQETVSLRNTSTQATFAYRLPISDNQFLFFGLSGVAGYNDLNLNGIDYSSDPAILKAASNRFYGDANFGLVYSLGTFRLGFAFPKLFGQPYFSPQDLVNTRYAQLRNQLYSASYKFKAGNFSVEPYALYRLKRDLQNWWELATLVYYKEKIWMGASYHSAQGIGFFFGADMKEKFRFSYNYELPIASSKFISTSTHEIHLQLRLGKKRDFKRTERFSEPEKAFLEEATPAKEEPVLMLKILPSEVPVKPIEELAVVKPEEETKPVVEPEKKLLREEDEIPVAPTKASSQEALPAGYYVIAGSFKNLDLAKVLQKRLTELGYRDVKSGMNPVNKLFYVYLFSSSNLEESRKMRDQLRLKDTTKAVWILKIEEH